DLQNAIKRIVPKIDMNKIKIIIDNIETLSDEQRSFYYESIMICKEQILDLAYNLLINYEI
ncbi:MAG: CtkA family protein, partial [Bacilli bacterium]|nr:CtkA family protein [Bacilli bacterium]